GCEMRLDSRKKAAEQLKEELSRAEMDAEAKRRQAELLSELDRSMDGFAHSVKCIMKEKEAGRLGGIRGTVSQLISVDKEYSVAIETALGNNMQNIVVGTEENAKRAISYLKQNNLGRATFLPVSTVRPQSFSEKGAESAPGFVGIASDLVKTADEYKNIVRSMLGKIVIAEDLDCAVSMAKKFGYKFRVVTLDGQVVHTGGSMTGGSISKNTEILSRKAKIKDAEAAAKQLEEKAKEISEKYKKASGELAETEGMLLGITGELTTANEDKIRVLGEIRRVNESVEGAKAAISELEEEKKDAGARIERNNLLIAEQQKILDGLVLRRNKANSRLSEINGAKDELSVKREEISNRNAGIRLKILAVEKEISAISDAVGMLRSQKDDVNGKTEELSRRRDQLLAANELISGKIEEMKKHSEFLRAKAEGSGGEIDEINKKRLENEAEITKLRAEDKELSNKREQLGNEAARLAERKQALIKENDEVTAKLFDEYQLTRSEAEEMNIEIDDIPAASKRVGELKAKIRALGNVNVSAIEEYKEVSERYEFMKDQINDVETGKKELVSLISELTGYMRETFTEKFEKINIGFSSTFTDLFGGGTAQLTLSDPSDILSSGIEITVQPPGKKVSSIEQLSGGEKTLVSLAVYFAIMQVSPPPFCMLDEVEAALDDVNVDRFAKYLRRMTGETQFIAITHRRGTMEEADVLYGVTMQEKGVSKLLKLDVTEIEKNLQLAK
ncbi:MAG: chromosome segregation protein SMC, partial [Acutalibacteraceae bacterium]